MLLKAKGQIVVSGLVLLAAAWGLFFAWITGTTILNSDVAFKEALAWTVATTIFGLSIAGAFVATHWLFEKAEEYGEFKKKREKVYHLVKDMPVLEVQKMREQAISNDLSAEIAEKREELSKLKALKYQDQDNEG